MTSANSPWSDSEALRAAVLAKAAEAGSCRTRFGTVGPVDARSALFYRQWIEQGAHGTMDYLAKYTDIRDNPAKLLEGARSMLCCAFAYHAAAVPRHELFADYARGQDYHTALRKRLQPVAKFMEEAAPGSLTRICIDTAPLRERYWAERCGLGCIGLNNQLYAPGVGSKVFIATILWTAEMRADKALAQNVCTACGACVNACPGGALDGKGGLDARRCLSYLTIEYRGELPDAVHLQGRRIYGCDICQDVCPLNHNTMAEDIIEEFKPGEEFMRLDRSKLSTLSQEEFSRLFSHSAIKRTKLAGLLRNLGK